MLLHFKTIMCFNILPMFVNNQFTSRAAIVDVTIVDQKAKHLLEVLSLIRWTALCGGWDFPTNPFVFNRFPHLDNTRWEEIVVICPLAAYFVDPIFALQQLVKLYKNRKVWNMGKIRIDGVVTAEKHWRHRFFPRDKARKFLNAHLLKNDLHYLRQPAGTIQIDYWRSTKINLKSVTSDCFAILNVEFTVLPDINSSVDGLLKFMICALHVVSWKMCFHIGISKN